MIGSNFHAAIENEVNRWRQSLQATKAEMTQPLVKFDDYLRQAYGDLESQAAQNSIPGISDSAPPNSSTNMRPTGSPNEIRETRGSLIHSSTAEGRYRGLIAEAARKNNLDPRLLTAVVRTESNFQPDAVSKSGARGLMQLMPQTAKILGVNPDDPAQNIAGGARHLGDLMRRYGDIPKALAAYNAGARAVDRHHGVPPFPETQRYVESILSLTETDPAE